MLQVRVPISWGSYTGSVQLVRVCSLVVQEAGGKFVGGEALVFGEESGV